MIKFFEWVDKHEATMLLYIIAFVCLWATPVLFLLLALPALSTYYMSKAMEPFFPYDSE